MACHMKRDVLIYSRLLGHLFQVSVHHLIEWHREYMIVPFSFVICLIPF